MERNRRDFLLGALTAAVLCWSPGIAIAQNASQTAGGEGEQLTLDVQGMH